MQLILSGKGMGQVTSHYLFQPLLLSKRFIKFLKSKEKVNGREKPTTPAPSENEHSSWGLDKQVLVGHISAPALDLASLSEITAADDGVNRRDGVPALQLPFPAHQQQLLMLTGHALSAIKRCPDTVPPATLSLSQGQECPGSSQPETLAGIAGRVSLQRTLRRAFVTRRLHLSAAHRS